MILKSFKIRIMKLTEQLGSLRTYRVRNIEYQLYNFDTLTFI